MGKRRAARQAAEDERDNLAAKIIQERERRARAEGELTGLRTAFDQLQGRAQRVEGERNAAAEASPDYAPGLTGMV